MAHNLNINNGKVSFAAKGEKAWHGLGTYVENAMTASEALELGGLNFEVAKMPISIAGTDIILENKVATVRMDNNQPLGVVSESYEVIQNADMFNFFDPIIDRGEAIYETVGALGKGERVFLSAKLPNDIVVKGEQVNNYILLTGGHDGRSPLVIGFTPVRVVCNNTLTIALRNIQNRYTIAHFKNADQKIKEASKAMGLASKFISELDPIMNQMAKVKMNDAQLKQFIIDAMKPAKEILDEEGKVKLSAQLIKTVESIEEFAHTHETQQTKAAKGTLWGAYNSISGWMHHVKDYKNDNDRMSDIVYNVGSEKISKAFDLAVSMM